MVWFSVPAVLLTFFLPVLLAAVNTPPAPEAEALAGAAPAPLRQEELVRDQTMQLTVRTENGDRVMSMLDYLSHAVAGEMPAVFSLEALKAQAVALRSYALFFQENRKEVHPEADICTSPGCCAAFCTEETLRQKWGAKYEEYLDKINRAVRETDGQYLAYHAAPVFALFHASSRSSTENGSALGLSAPWLVSVSTPETASTVTNLDTTVLVSSEDFRSTILQTFPDALLPQDNPGAWTGAVTMNDSGRVSQIEIGSVSISGLTIRQLFGLRSTNFTLAWDAEQNHFVFRVSGYGHGVGMSQYGASLMAASGADYTEILAHYYPGTTLDVRKTSETLDSAA